MGFAKALHDGRAYIYIIICYVIIADECTVGRLGTDSVRCRSNS